MKKYIFLILFLAFSFSVFSQNKTKIKRDTIEAVDGLKVSGKMVNSISNDTTLTTSDSLALITSYAVKAYIRDSTISSTKNRFVYVQDFGAVGDGVTDDWQNIQNAVNSLNDWDYLLFEEGKTYLSSGSIYLDSLQGVTLDFNNSTLKRTDGSTEETTLSAEYVSGSTTVEVASVPPTWKINDRIFLITGNDNNGLSSKAQITNISGTTITIQNRWTEQGLGGADHPNAPIGTTVMRNRYMIDGRPSEDDGTDILGGANRFVTIKNGIFDGNRANNQTNLSWFANNGIAIHGRGSKIINNRFINHPSEVIIGHGLFVAFNDFIDNGGSAYHMSGNDRYYDEMHPTWFVHNYVIRTNETAYAINSHNEGIISYSWNGGDIFVENNYMDGLTTGQGVLGSITSSGTANDRENTKLANNYLRGFSSLVYGTHEDLTQSLTITDNTLDSFLNPIDFQSISLNDEILIQSNIPINGTEIRIPSTFNESNKNNISNLSYGFEALDSLKTGSNNVVFGQSGLTNLDNANRNIGIGGIVGFSKTVGDDNVLIGYWANGQATSGNQNVYIGTESGRNNNGSGNVMIGYKAGRFSTSSNKLYIDNSETATPLIEGDFSTNELKINGDLVGTGTAQLSSYGSGTNTGTATYLLGVDANGDIIEESLGGGGGGDVDFYKVGTTAAPTLITDDKFTTGDVGIGLSTTTAKLDVQGDGTNVAEFRTSTNAVAMEIHDDQGVAIGGTTTNARFNVFDTQVSEYGLQWRYNDISNNAPIGWSQGPNVTAGQRVYERWGTHISNTYESVMMEYYHTGDLSQNNYIGFSVQGGVNKAILNGFGNFGINTTTPLAKLNVIGDGTGSAKNILTEDSGGTDLFYIQDDGDGYFSGNIGFGTTSPDAKIDIVATTDNQITLTNSKADAVIKFADIAMIPYTIAEQNSSLINAQIGSGFSFMNIGGGVGTQNALERLDFFAAADETTLAGTRMARLDITGLSVGNGALSATEMLDVDGVARVRDFMKLDALSTPPSTPATGWIYMDDGTCCGGTPTLRYYNGTSWVDL